MTSVFQALRFELDPNNVARSALASHAGASRFAFNWGRALVKWRLDQAGRLREQALVEGSSPREAEAAARTVPVPWSLAALRKEWNQAKHTVAPWWAENSKEAYNSGLDALARALDGWSKSRRGKRKGRTVGFPRRKKLGGRRSFRVTTGAFGVLDGRHVRLPRIGVIRTKEPTTALARRLDTGAARVLSATVSETAGRWYVSFGVEMQRRPRSAAEERHRRPVVGVDLGVSSLAVLSTGERIPNPRHLSRYARRTARLQEELARRHGPSKGRLPSKRWRDTKARLGRTHAKVARARGDGLHKLTTALAKNHEVVVVEGLNVAGMTATAKGSGHWRGKAGLNRAILDTAPAELRRQLGYKTAWYGSKLFAADRWYPSSKTCSRCQTVKAKLSLAERIYRCEHCGLVIDRDLNASFNLVALVGAVTGTGSGPGTGQGDLADAQGEERSMGSPRCSSANCEDGSPTLRREDSARRRTVTATRQRMAPKPVLIGSDR